METIALRPALNVPSTPECELDEWGTEAKAESTKLEGDETGSTEAGEKSVAFAAVSPETTVSVPGSLARLPFC
jgi:hypothetical protein